MNCLGMTTLKAVQMYMSMVQAYLSDPVYILEEGEEEDDDDAYLKPNK